MSAAVAVVGGIVGCAILIYALDRLFRPRSEKLSDVELYGDGAGVEGGSGDGGD